MSFDSLEASCVWIPEGGELPSAIPWGNPAIFPATFIPDNYQGPRPGYPWIEFGRMTLQRRKTAGPRRGRSEGTSASFARSASATDSEPEANALGQFAPGVARSATVKGSQDEPASYEPPDVGAARRPWNGLSDLGATMTALEATSPASPFVTSAARRLSGGLVGEKSSGRDAQDRPGQPAQAVLRQAPATGTEIEPVGYTTNKVDNSTARAPGMTRDELRRALHNLKDAIGLGGADNVEIHIPSGDVFFNGENIGNLRDE